MPDVLVLNADQLRCLASPLRNEVLTRLRVMGQGSARELGDAVGKGTEAVHYHLKQLESVGLVKPLFKRPAPKKPETVYGPVGDRLNLPSVEGDPELDQLARNVVLTGMRQVMRGYEKAATKALSDPTVRPNLLVQRTNVKLGTEDLVRFRHMLTELQKFLDEHRDEAGTRVHWHSILYPID